MTRAIRPIAICQYLILLQKPLFLESNHRRLEAFKSVTIPFRLQGVLISGEGDLMEWN